MYFGPYNLNRLPSLIIQNLEVPITSSITHIWGPNGVGKSTLMSLILEEIKSKKLKFAYINQNYRSNWLWWFSVRKNLEMAAKKTNFTMLEDLPVIQKNISWLKPFLDDETKQVNFAKENEFNTMNLSGGQLQRLILLRELLHNPDFLLLDESFSALDKNVSLEIIDWLLKEQELSGFKIISIVHDKSLLKSMPGQILELSLGEGKVLQLNEKDYEKFI